MIPFHIEHKTYCIRSGPKSSWLPLNWWFYHSFTVIVPSEFAALTSTAPMAASLRDLYLLPTFFVCVCINQQNWQVWLQEVATAHLKKPQWKRTRQRQERRRWVQSLHRYSIGDMVQMPFILSSLVSNLGMFGNPQRRTRRATCLNCTIFGQVCMQVLRPKKKCVWLA